MAEPFNEQKFVRNHEVVVVRRLEAVGILLRNHIREMISVPSRTVTIGKTKGGKTKRVLGRRGSNRSVPGEPPHKDYGKLRESIASDVDAAGLTVRVGTPLRYGKFLELGTRKMAPRPYLRRALAELKPRINAVMSQGKLK